MHNQTQLSNSQGEAWEKDRGAYEDIGLFVVKNLFFYLKENTRVEEKGFSFVKGLVGHSSQFHGS